MLQVFHVDVAKVDWDIAYVAMAIQVYCVYCKRLFQIFQLFQTDVARVLSGCCICFTLKLQVFHPAVAYVFTHMLQVFHIDVAYVLQCPHTYFPRVSDDVASVSTVSDVCCKCFL
jgi:hypothetical protein